MTPEQITIAVAELDGINIRSPDCVVKGGWLDHTLKSVKFKPYTTSRDAIIPVIEKQDVVTQVSIIHFLSRQDLCGADRFCQIDYCALEILKATPLQLCTALLKATGKWKD